MKIYIADINNFNTKQLNKYISLHKDEYDGKNSEKLKQHFLSLYLTETIAKQVFKIKNTKIKYKNNKPFFVNSNICFSISHSDNIVAVTFADNNIGIDVENNIKERDFNKIFKRYNIKLSSNDQNNLKKIFYDFWTAHEAKIKLNSQKDIYIDYNYSVNGFTICVAQEIPFKISEVIWVKE